MSERLHSCGYFCDRPECAIAQRDELVLAKQHMEQRIKELEERLAQDHFTYTEFEKKYKVCMRAVTRIIRGLETDKMELETQNKTLHMTQKTYEDYEDYDELTFEQNAEMRELLTRWVNGFRTGKSYPVGETIDLLEKTK